MVRVAALQVIDVQRGQSVIHEALKELVYQVYVELSDQRTREIDAELQTRTARQVNHYPCQGFIQRNVSVTVAANADFVSQRLGDRLPQCNTHILDRVMRIDLQVSGGDDIQVQHAVARDLIQHVVEKPDTGLERRLAGAVQIDLDTDLRLQRVACYLGLSHVGSGKKRSSGGLAQALLQSVEKLRILLGRAGGDTQAAR